MLWQIFITFLRVGAFTIGGGYAMLPLIRREVCEKHKWMDEMAFMDGLAAAQSSPGPIAINLSIYVGYHLRKGKGMAAAVLGTVLPSLISIIIIASLFSRYADSTLARKAFRALKPAVVALIALPLIEMAKKIGIKLNNFWVPLVALILVGILGISPAHLILLTILVTIWLSDRNSRKV
ncbi:MAG: chromate transporter [Candidatus Cloacimonetes bacterium]|nr:chromate transporter [Candidatus Cloacimonadota bacterium]